MGLEIGPHCTPAFEGSWCAPCVLLHSVVLSPRLPLATTTCLPCVSPLLLRFLALPGLTRVLPFRFVSPVGVGAGFS